MMKVRSRALWLAILIGAVLLTPTPGFAQVYVGGYGGAVLPDGADFDPGVMAGVRIGYWNEVVNAPYAGVEVEVYGGLPENKGTDLDMLALGINGLFRYPYGPIQPYGGVGLGVVYGEVEGDDDTAVAFQAMGGVRGFIKDNVALFAEYKWVSVYLDELEFKGIELDYSASNVFGGIEFHFGPSVHKMQ
jgi:opacity protein-like surface antigen